MVPNVSKLKKLNSDGTNSRKSTELISNTEILPEKSIKNKSINRKTESDTRTRNRLSSLKTWFYYFMALRLVLLSN